MTQLYSTQREPSVPFVYEIHFGEWVLITLTENKCTLSSQGIF